MGLNILKSVSVSILLLISIGCEDNAVLGPQRTQSEPIHVIVTMPLIERIELNDYSWQTLMTIYGNLSSEDADVEFMRVEWDYDMFWSINDVECPVILPYSIVVYGMSMFNVNSFVVAADWYWSLTVTENVYALVESVKSLGSIVPIKFPCGDSVIPVGKDPVVTM